MPLKLSTEEAELNEFRLQGLLDYRRRSQEKIEYEMSNEYIKLHQATSQIDVLRQELDLHIMHLETTEHACLDTCDLNMLRSAYQHSLEEIDRQKAFVQQIQDVILRKQKDVIQRRKDVQILEKLQEKQAHINKKAEAFSEMLHLEDIAILRFNHGH